MHVHYQIFVGIEKENFNTKNHEETNNAMTNTSSTDSASHKYLI